MQYLCPLPAGVEQQPRIAAEGIHAVFQLHGFALGRIGFRNGIQTRFTFFALLPCDRHKGSINFKISHRHYSFSVFLLDTDIIHIESLFVKSILMIF